MTENTMQTIVTKKKGSSMRTRDFKDRACDLREEYDEQMVNELLNQITDYLYNIDEVTEVSSEDVETLIVAWQDKLPDPDEWAMEESYNEYNNAMEDRADYMRDEERGL